MYTPKNTSYSLYCLLVLLTAWSSACTEVNLEEDNNSTEKLLNGTATQARPEVGRLALHGGLCTATLVSPSVIITAAHCVDYETQVKSYGNFVINGSQSYPIDAAVSFAGDLGDKDIALLHLSSAVSGVQPARIAQSLPSAGTPSELFGFGCQNRSTQQGSGSKQIVTFTYGEGTFNLCPGDSGGPGMISRSGDIISINSAYYPDSGSDVFAYPSYIYNDLNNIMNVFEQQGAQAGVQAFGNGTQPQSNDPSGQGTTQDECSLYGYYGDGVCDAFCLMPDPDCQGQNQNQNQNQNGQNQNQNGQNQNQNGQSDECADYGYYGDGVCDEFCSSPDPDCQSQQQNQNQNQNGQGDECADFGYYGDGVCDEFCANPDPDCQGQDQGNYDECADFGYYGDGVCDDFCANPDPDCY